MQLDLIPSKYEVLDFGGLNPRKIYVVNGKTVNSVDVPLVGGPSP